MYSTIPCLYIQRRCNAGPLVILRNFNLNFDFTRPFARISTSWNAGTSESRLLSHLTQHFTPTSASKTSNELRLVRAVCHIGPGDLPPLHRHPTSQSETPTQSRFLAAGQANTSAVLALCSVLTRQQAALAATVASSSSIRVVGITRNKRLAFHFRCWFYPNTTKITQDRGW
jgi:hypothetical protein